MKRRLLRPLGGLIGLVVSATAWAQAPAPPVPIAPAPAPGQPAAPAPGQPAPAPGQPAPGQPVPAPGQPPPAAAPPGAPAPAQPPAALPPAQAAQPSSTAPAEQPPPQPPAQPPAVQPPPPASQPAATPGLSWNAQTAPQADTDGKTFGTALQSRPLWMRLYKSSFRWDQSATTQTVGLGDDLQSSNPTYDWSFLLAPRYYLYDDEVQKYSLRAQLGLAREFTNNDATTDQGEWTLTDALLTSVYGRQLYSDGEWDTVLTLRAPDLSFPTSKVSASVGKILGVGGGVGLWQTIPINGTKAKALQNFLVIPSVGYTYTFTDFTEATADDLNLTRMDLAGQSVPTNQLSGVAFAQHQMDLSITTDLAITDRVSWGNVFGWRPTWKYEFDAENDDQLCGVVATGCITPDRLEDRTNFVVVTTFSSELAVRVFDEMTIAVGYNNISGQIGPDGKRRNMFYSPDARVFLSAIAHIDEIMKTLAGGEAEPAKPSRRTSRRAAPPTVQ